MVTSPTPTPDPQALRLLQRALVDRTAFRPACGWLRTLREALGFSRSTVAKAIGVTPAAIQFFERSDASEAITVSSLRRLAEAMGCDVAITITPKTGSSFYELTGQTDPEAGSYSRATIARGPVPARRSEFDQEFES